jgi:hypothetical protein
MNDNGLFLCILIGLAGSGLGCVGTAAVDDERVTDQAEAIQVATAEAYPEVVLIDVQRGGQPGLSCTGALLTPSVVLTSARCASAYGEVLVRAPFASGQAAWGVRAAVPDYGYTYDAPSAGAHDVGLLELDRPLYLAS